MRVLFLVGSLRMGGAERVVSRLSNYWAEKGFDVCVATVREKESDFYSLHPNVERLAFSTPPKQSEKYEHYLQQYRAAKSEYKHVARFEPLLRVGASFRQRYIRYKKYYNSLRETHRAIQAFEPDVVISFMTGMNFRALAMRPISKAPIIISERTNPDKQKINRRGNRVRRLTYRYAHKVVFVSEGVADAYPWLPAAKKLVIYNPAGFLPTPPEHRVAEKTIVTLGRLNRIKGHDLLIAAFDKIAGRHPEWRLRIFGEGDCRPNLEAQIAQSPYKDRITLEGFTRSPDVSLRSAGMFVLSSRHEGFPNALVEAMSMGLPVISFDCPYGPSELIEDHVNGLLVASESTDELAAAMEYMIANPEQREAMARRASEVSQLLSMETIAGKWEALIEELVGSR